MSDARVLAELMGYRVTDDPYEHWQFALVDHLGEHVIGGNDKDELWDHVPAFPTDLNAMREVWKVLKERGLWDEFCAAFDNHTFREAGVKGDFDLRWHFVHDLPGQVKAAIKVFKEAQ